MATFKGFYAGSVGSVWIVSLNINLVLFCGP